MGSDGLDVAHILYTVYNVYMLAGTLATGGGWVVGWLSVSCASRFVLRARMYTKYIALAKLRCFVICVRMGCWRVSDGG